MKLFRLTIFNSFKLCNTFIITLSLYIHKQAKFQVYEKVRNFNFCYDN
jgi:hypothetical protein